MLPTNLRQRRRAFGCLWKVGLLVWCGAIGRCVQGLGRHGQRHFDLWAWNAGGGSLAASLVQGWRHQHSCLVWWQWQCEICPNQSFWFGSSGNRTFENSFDGRGKQELIDLGCTCAYGSKHQWFSFEACGTSLSDGVASMQQTCRREVGKKFWLVFLWCSEIYNGVARFHFPIEKRSSVVVVST